MACHVRLTERRATLARGVCEKVCVKAQHVLSGPWPCRSRKLHFFCKYLLASAFVMCLILVMLWYIPGFRPFNPIYAMTTVSLWCPYICLCLSVHLLHVPCVSSMLV